MTIKKKDERKTTSKKTAKSKTARISPTSRVTKEVGQGGALAPEKQTIPNEKESGRVIDSSKKMSVLSLRDAVVFPHMVVPLFVGRPKSVKAIEDAMIGNRQILLVTQKNHKVENPGGDDIYQVGTVGEILQMMKMPDGIIKILVEGLQRVRLKTLYQSKEKTQAEFEILNTYYVPKSETKAFGRYVVDLFEKYIKMDNKIPLEVIMIVNNIDDIDRLGDVLTGHLVIPLEEKQKILEIANPVKRLERISEIISSEIEIGSLEKKIRGRVKKQMEKIQRDYYLREQIRAISTELGEGEEKQDEIDEFEEQLKNSAMPKEAKKKVEKEIRRLAKMPSGSAEATVVSNYVECLLDLPWKKPGKIKIDIDKASQILEEDHFGLNKVKERILEFLAVCTLKKEIRGPILCLIGPPGVGKTSLGKSIARAMNRKFIRISLGGMKDEAEIRGHRKTYIGAMPGRIIQALRDAGTMNPVCLLDEIDKLGSDFRGDPSSALLEVLDPEQNNTFSDHYLNLPYDLSNVFFVTTANVPHTIPPALLDRMEVIRIPGYTENEKLKIAQKFLVPKQIANNGIEKLNVTADTSAIEEVIRNYTAEAGVRTLERTIGTICRKIAVNFLKNQKSKTGASKKISRVKVTPALVKKHLGPPTFKNSTIPDKSRVGVATGLAWTQVGGTVLPVETKSMPGKGRLVLTGQLGSVMKESCQAALSFLKSNQKEFGLSRTKFSALDIHIHFPEGAIPKDGPSAGITISTSLLSCLKNRRVKESLAMTGEINLSGQVLPVGGIKEKLIAAHRQGYREIILSKENEVDLEEIPGEILKELEIHPVSEINEVFSLALVPQRKRRSTSIK